MLGTKRVDMKWSHVEGRVVITGMAIYGRRESVSGQYYVSSVATHFVTIDSLSLINATY